MAASLMEFHCSLVTLNLLKVCVRMRVYAQAHMHVHVIYVLVGVRACVSTCVPLHLKAKDQRQVSFLDLSSLCLLGQDLTDWRLTD